LLTVEDWAEIRRLHLAEGLGKQTIGSKNLPRPSRSKCGETMLAKLGDTRGQPEERTPRFTTTSTRLECCALVTFRGSAPPA
jgi:hypothetical protein